MMNVKPRRKHRVGGWVASLPGSLLGTALALAHFSPSHASTYQLSDCFMSGGCPTAGPYGTVTLTSVNSTDVSVTLMLTAGEVFNFSNANGAGKPLLFDISGNPAVTATNLPSGWALTQQPMTMADGTGQWDYFITCSTCGNGTKNLVSGPISFDLSLASGISPASFAANANGLLFAADIGIPTGSNQYTTGDVAAPPAVPLPPAAALLGSGLLALFLLMLRGSARATLRPVTP